MCGRRAEGGRKGQERAEGAEGSRVGRVGKGGCVVAAAARQQQRGLVGPRVGLVHQVDDDAHRLVRAGVRVGDQSLGLRVRVWVRARVRVLGFANPMGYDRPKPKPKPKPKPEPEPKPKPDQVVRAKDKAKQYRAKADVLRSKAQRELQAALEATPQP